MNEKLLLTNQHKDHSVFIQADNIRVTCDSSVHNYSSELNITALLAESQSTNFWHVKTSLKSKRNEKMNQILEREIGAVAEIYMYYQIYKITTHSITPFVKLYRTILYYTIIICTENIQSLYSLSVYLHI